MENNECITIKQAKEFFDGRPERVYSTSDLMAIFATNRSKWKLARFGGFEKIVHFLAKHTPLLDVRLKSSSHRSIRKFTWRDCSPYRLALSLRKGAYLSHATASRVLGLTNSLPRTIHINAEQSPKPPGESPNQEAINRAFSREQRQSSNVFSYGEWRFVLLNGKNTGRLGVIANRAPDGEAVEATDVERTLIDMVVRPAYAGGVDEVLNAYRAAKTRASFGKLLHTLRRLDYVYPYHQAIGFCIQRVGYGADQFDRLKKLGLHLDFFLAHAMKRVAFDEEWKLWYPRGLDTDNHSL